MESFELNKILGGILTALLVVTAVRLAAAALYAPSEAVGMHGPEVSAITAPLAAAPEKPLAELLKTASIERGQRVSKKCVSCHTFNKGGPNRIGPNLWNILNSKAAQQAGFGYSAAMKKHSGKWGYQELAAFLKKPRQFISGTNMSFAGLRKPEDRAAIILYLRSLSDKKPALP